ncbi:MAG: hypothetical protein ABII71_05780 [Candidatus Micrarchaeota archaeon]
MNFGKVDRILLLGGSPLLAEVAAALSKEWDLTVFSCRRQLDEPMDGKGTTLEQLLKNSGTKYFCADDINQDDNFLGVITGSTLAIGIGEQWTFTQDVISRFAGRLVDFMGIPLPKFRGGAHYTWQILQKNRTGCCNIQEINAEMVPGEFDSGKLLKRKEYQFSESARTPLDYFNEAGKNELGFLLEFVREVKEGKDFSPMAVDESASLFMPRLYTKKHGLVDWSWNTDEIDRFICAFDEPYPGASTYLDGKKVFLKGSSIDSSEGAFHPFQCGLVYKVHGGSLFVATRDGTVKLGRVLDENGNDITESVAVGQRFFTPRNELDDAMGFRAGYSTKGMEAKK